jgi:hypothetical protein
MKPKLRYAIAYIFTYIHTVHTDIRRYMYRDTTNTYVSINVHTTIYLFIYSSVYLHLRYTHTYILTYIIHTYIIHTYIHTGGRAYDHRQQFGVSQKRQASCRCHSRYKCLYVSITFFFVKNDYSFSDFLTGAYLLTQKGDTNMYVCAQN